jgi:bacteriocin-like protein
MDKNYLTDKELENVAGGNNPEIPEQTRGEFDAFKEKFWSELEKSKQDAEK